MEVITQEKYLFDPSGIYYVPQVSDHEEFLDYVRSFPMTTAPSVFGMNENADIIKDQQETTLMLSSLLATQVRVQLRNTVFIWNFDIVILYFLAFSLFRISR